MEYIHTECGGNIVHRTCLKCGQHWSLVHFTISPNIRLKSITLEDKKREIRERGSGTRRQPADYAGWADSVPFVSTVAKLLPNWKRKWRITSFIIFYGVVITGIVLLFRECG